MSGHFFQRLAARARSARSGASEPTLHPRIPSRFEGLPGLAWADEVPDRDPARPSAVDPNVLAPLEIAPLGVPNTAENQNTTTPQSPAPTERAAKDSATPKARTRGSEEPPPKERTKAATEPVAKLPSVRMSRHREAPTASPSFQGTTFQGATFQGTTSQAIPSQVAPALEDRAEAAPGLPLATPDSGPPRQPTPLRPLARPKTLGPQRRPAELATDGSAISAFSAPAASPFSPPFSPPFSRSPSEWQRRAPGETSTNGTPADGSIGLERAPAPEPTVTVSIGRIVVRAERPAVSAHQPRQQAAKPRSTGPSLADYLERRRPGTRR